MVSLLVEIRVTAQERQNIRRRLPGKTINEMMSVALDMRNAKQTRQRQVMLQRQSWLAYFSPSWTAFQVDGGRDFNVVVDGVAV